MSMMSKVLVSFGVIALLAGSAYAGDPGKKVDKVFARLDADKDGKISRKEAEAAGPKLAKHFDMVDTNSDGYVTKDELRAALQKLKDKKKEK